MSAHERTHSPAGPRTHAALEERRREIQRAFAKADTAMLTGSVTSRERDALLTHLYGSAHEREALAAVDRELAAIAHERAQEAGDGMSASPKAASLVAGFCVIMVSLFAVLFSTTGGFDGVTGAVVLEAQGVAGDYAQDASLPLVLEGTTRVNASGVARGEGDITITLVQGEERYVLYAYRHSAPQSEHASLPKAVFDEGEDVTFEARDVSSAYLMDGAQALPLGDATTISGLAQGEYEIVLIINDSALTQERLPFTVVAPGTGAIEEEFDACGDACRVNLTGNATLEIEVRDAATLSLAGVTLRAQPNRAPQAAAQAEDIEGEETVHVDLARLFSDPDGDALEYLSSEYPENEEGIEDGILTVTGPPGTYAYVAYATDGVELASSDMFAITLTGARAQPPQDNLTQQPGSNVTGNETPQDGGNVTGNETGNATGAGNATQPPGDAPSLPPQANATAPTQGTCADLDPNRRPLECIQGNESTYFRPEDLLIENKEALAVGTLTPIGNLLLRGGIVERSSASPASHDYQMGYTGPDGEFVPTVWIDTQSGDLHLLGTLTEANGNIPLEEGMSAIANSRGIVLALIDRQAGDLVVRGNVIPYRRSLS